MSHPPEAQLGVHLLETITLGMYSEPLHCVREYIQNAFDSIRAARRKGLLAADAGCIDVIVDPHAKALRIRDDGTGLSPEEAVVRLVDIGYSSKANTIDQAATNAGFRGIGRMAGISYCDRLVFETSDGCGRTCVIAFDARAINRLTRPGQAPTTIAEAIKSNTAFEERPSESDERFLQVSLEQISNWAVLDLDSLAAYLEQTAPVRHDPTTWKFETKIRSIADSAGYPESLDTVSIRICAPDGAVQREVFRPFKDSFDTKDARGQARRSVNVTDVVALPRGGDYRGWWGWLAQHQRRGALADVPFSGLRVRMHNIAIGDHSPLQVLWTSRPLARWCFGEIHVVDPVLVPNSQRDNFEPSDALSRIHEQLKDEIRRIEKEIRDESRDRNTSVRKITQRAENATKHARRRLEEGLTSHNEKTQLIESLDKEASRLNSTIQSRNRTDAERTQLEQALLAVEELKEEISRVRRTDADASMSHLNKQARNAVRTVLAVVKEMLDDDKLFAAIEQRVVAALRPGSQER
ncbi:MAG: hypothetical protein F4X12_22080 [Acidobacteriia bacterium]|nr:hypothetical protein [Terriglobia bacterium]